MAIRRVKTGWQVDYYPEGRRGGRRYKTFPTKRLAEQWDARRKQERYEWEIAGEGNRVKDIYFSEFAEKFLNQVSDAFARSTSESYETVVGRFGAFLKGDPFLRDITTSEVSEFMMEVRRIGRKDGKRYSERSINMYVENLKAMFNAAIRWGYLKKSPAELLKKGRMERKAPRILSRDEIRRVLEAAPEYLKDIIYLGYFEGMRKQEIFRLRWEDMDFEHRGIVISQTKNKRARILPMHQEVFERFSIRKAERIQKECVVQKDGRPIRDNVKRALRSAFLEAGVEPAGLHSLRHSFAVNALRAGIPIRTVQKWLDHESVKTTMRYLAFTDDMVMSDMERLPGL